MTKINNKYNISYSIKVLQRQFSEKELEEFHEGYKAACLKQYSSKMNQPNKFDLKVADMYKKENLTISEISQRTGTSYSKVNSSLVRVAKFKTYFE